MGVRGSSGVNIIRRIFRSLPCLNMILIHLLFVSIFTKNPIFFSFLLNNIENNIANTELDNYKCIQMYMYEFLYPQ